MSRFFRFAFPSSRSALRASSICSLILLASASSRSRTRRWSGVSPMGGAVIWAKGSTVTSNERPIWMVVYVCRTDKRPGGSLCVGPDGELDGEGGRRRRWDGEAKRSGRGRPSLYRVWKRGFETFWPAIHRQLRYESGQTEEISDPYILGQHHILGGSSWAGHQITTIQQNLWSAGTTLACR